MDKQTDQINWEQYLIPGTEILKNKFNIKNIDDLKEVENIITRKSIAKLYLNPVEGNFDLKHLKEIHKKIFKEIYPFAGELRNCTLQKDSHVFCNPENIELIVNKTLEDMNKEFEQDISSIPEFAYKLAKYYYNLIYAHPFREGNGRSIRVFIRDFVCEKSKKVKGISIKGILILHARLTQNHV